MLNILVVEDEGLVAADLESVLQSLGHSTMSAASGELALQLAAANAFELAFLDIRLAGDLDGVETAEILGKRFKLGIVFLTAHSDPAILARAQDARPFGYIAKPFRELDIRVYTERFARHLKDQSERPKSEELLMSEFLENMKRRKEDLEGAIRAVERVTADASGQVVSRTLAVPIKRKRGRPYGSKNRPLTARSSE